MSGGFRHNERTGHSGLCSPAASGSERSVAIALLVVLLGVTGVGGTFGSTRSAGRALGQTGQLVGAVRAIPRHGLSACRTTCSSTPEHYANSAVTPSGRRRRRSLGGLLSEAPTQSPGAHTPRSPTSATRPGREEDRSNRLPRVRSICRGGLSRALRIPYENGLWSGPVRVERPPGTGSRSCWDRPPRQPWSATPRRPLHREPAPSDFTTPARVPVASGPRAQLPPGRSGCRPRPGPRRASRGSSPPAGSWASRTWSAAGTASAVPGRAHV